jgi:urease accessory protein
MIIIHAPLPALPPELPRIPLSVQRLTLAKRRWRGTAADGAEFGFDLATPLTHAAPFHVGTASVYLIAQLPEPVLEIALIARPAPVARLGWTIGNLHFPIQVTDEVIRVPDDPALRQLFARENIPFTEAAQIFEPFARHHRHE